MRKIISVFLTALLFSALTACGSSAKAETAGTAAVTEAQTKAAETTAAAETQTNAAETTAAAEVQTSAPAAHSDVLVAYFSATGTTKGVAERIASVTGGDLYEILAAKPYSAADLNYNDRSSRSTKEQNDKSVRPEIGSENLSLEGYKTIYLGFPIWWGEEPRILDTFARPAEAASAEAGATWRPLRAAAPGWKENGSAEMCLRRNSRPGSTA